MCKKQVPMPEVDNSKNLETSNYGLINLEESNMGTMGKEKGCKLICWKPAMRRIDKYFLVLIQSAVMWSSVLSLIFHFDLILAFPRMVVVMLI